MFIDLCCRPLGPQIEMEITLGFAHLLHLALKQRYLLHEHHLAGVPERAPIRGDISLVRLAGVNWLLGK